jgi:recombination protein RecT
MADIVRQEAPKGILTLKAIMQKYAPDIQQLIPQHVKAERIVLIAQAALTKNPKLMDCDPRTVLSGIIQASIMGLELHSALHHASLVPFWNERAKMLEATLMIEYPGLIELVCRGGEASYIEAQPIYSNDVFEFQYGTNPQLIHKPELRAKRGELIGAYAYAKLRTGDTKFHVMSRDDIEKRRSISKAKDVGPWVTWEAEMYAKTPLRHLCKQLRKTTELSLALAHEDRFDQDIHSVVETGEGLSLDFLSMNIDAKTLEQKENLKNRIADKSQSDHSQTSASNSPAPFTTTSIPKGEQPIATGMDETKRRLAEAANKAKTAAPKTSPTPPVNKESEKTAAQESLLPEPTPQESAVSSQGSAESSGAAEIDPDLASLYASQANAPEPAEETKKPVAPKLDAMDAQISEPECKELVKLVGAKKIDGKLVREQLNGLHQPGKSEGGTTMLRYLTKRNAANLAEWLNRQ